WMPVFVLQVLFTSLQIVWLLALPGFSLLLAVMIITSIAGMWLERRAQMMGQVTTYRASRAAAISAGVLACFIWLPQIDITTTSGIVVLAAAVVIRYQRVAWFAVLYSALVVLAGLLEIHRDGGLLLILGMVQLGIGVGIMVVVRPPRYRTLRVALFAEIDWATPPLWVGALTAGLGMAVAWQQSTAIEQIVAVPLVLALTTAILASIAGVRHAPYVPLSLLAMAVLITLLEATTAPFTHIGDRLLLSGSGLAVAAIFIRHVISGQLARQRPLRRVRSLVWWLRPLRQTTGVAAFLSFMILITVSRAYPASAVLLIVNSVLLTIFSLVYFVERITRLRLWILAGMIGVTWLLTLDAFGVESVFWQLVPLALVLFGLAHLLEQSAVEWVAVLLFIGGGVLNLSEANFAAVPLLVLGLQILALIVYGYSAGRRIPFSAGVALTASGAVVVIGAINLWLVPLTLGVGLMSLALLVEVQRELVARWADTWSARWRVWR
ncbi:MAG: hypothetical protein GYB67_07910, partial [Chloroflexi bacterium]|nr:hypothetical protein [Chloroflexota bacterium]